MFRARSLAALSDPERPTAADSWEWAELFLSAWRGLGVFFAGFRLAERLLGKLEFNPADDFIYDRSVLPNAYKGNV